MKKDKAYRIIAQLCARYGNSVLDIGCGRGVQYAAIREIAPEVKYTGVDIIPKIHWYSAIKFFTLLERLKRYAKAIVYVNLKIDIKEE